MRLMYIIGFPPPYEVKKCIPANRSKKSIPKVPVRIGNANITRTMLAATVHTKIGIRIKVIPGARIVRIVVKKLIPDRKSVV